MIASILQQLVTPCLGEVAPKVVWAAKAGGVSLDSSHALALDASGNLYVAGVFAGTATFGATSLTATVGSDLFLAKLSPAGAWLWAKDVEPGVPGIERFLLQVDSAGNPVLCTTIAGDQAGDGLNVLFIAKYSPAGAPSWSKKLKPGGFSSVIGGAMALDASNNIYVTGVFGNTVDFGGVSLTDSGGGDIFLAKYGPAGGLMASKRFGGTTATSDEGRGLAIDSLGNGYLAATFTGPATFGGAPVASAGGTDVALIQFDAALVTQRVLRFGGVGNDVAEGLVRDPSDRLVLLASFSEDTMLGTTRITPDIANQLVAVQLNPLGTIGWVRPLGQASVSVSGSRGWITDAIGNLFLSTGNRLVKLGAGGAFVWERHTGPTLGVGSLNGVAVQNYTNVFITGAFQGTAAMDAVSLAASGMDDAYVARLVIDTTPPPVITVQPRSVVAPLGANAVFSVTASGSGPLQYQWFFGNSALAGATASTLTITNLTFVKAGVYSVVVRNSGGETASIAAQLEVTTPPPTIVVPPQSASVNVGQDVQFTVTAKGFEPLFYQWRLRGTNLPNATTSLLVLRGVGANDGGPYTVVVGNPGGYPTSVVATLTVKVVPPTIVTQPQSLTLAEGGTAVFRVGATGSPTLQYQWQKNGQPLPGRTGDTLTLFNVTESDVATYRVLVSNGAGSVLSADAAFSIQQPLLQGEPFSWTAAWHSLCGDVYKALTWDAGGNLYAATDQPSLQLPGLIAPTSCGYGFGVGKMDSEGRGIWRTFKWILLETCWSWGPTLDRRCRLGVSAAVDRSFRGPVSRMSF